MRHRTDGFVVDEVDGALFVRRHPLAPGAHHGVLQHGQLILAGLDFVQQLLREARRHR